MAWKRPAVYLTNGKKHFCGLCNCDMTLLKKEFEMKQIGGNDTISVFEEILFCPECKKFFITKEMSRALVRKHPGYYVDTSLYDLRPTKKGKKKQLEQPTNAKDAVASNKSRIPADNPNRNAQKPMQNPLENNIRNVGLNAQIYLSNTYSAANNICPFCRSVMSREHINIPIIERNEDFYPYSTEKIRFCHKCRKAFLTKEMALYILSEINYSSNSQKTIKIENVAIQWDEDNNKYLFNPTSNNSWDIYFPRPDYEIKSTSNDAPAEMELNAQSFLGKMGYSTSKGINIRRHILTEAIKTHGKRKVADHLAFLISTRKAQKNGTLKYANAIKIWQDDLNYISDQ